MRISTDLRRCPARLAGRRVVARWAAAGLLTLTISAARAEESDENRMTVGPHPVGFVTFVVTDSSRAFSVRGTFRARPVVIAVWYPAKPGTGTRMRLGDYVALEGAALARSGLLDAPERLKEEFFAEGEKRGAGRSELEGLLAHPTRARKGAEPDKARWPLVLWAHTDTLAKALPAEYLAGHGFVVASASVVGTFERDLDVGLSGAETQARDLELASAELSARRRADPTRVAIIGMSFGGLSEICYALRHPELRAIVSLDGGAGSASGAATLQQSAYFDAGRLTLPILHLYQPEGADTGFFESLRYSRRTLIRFPDLRHVDFSGSGLLEDLAPGYLGPPSKDRRAPRAVVWRTTLAFLAGTLTAPDGPSFHSFASSGETHLLEPLPPPLLLEELRGLVSRGGIRALEEAYRQRLGRDPTPISEDTCRKLGTWLLETRGREDARRLFEIQVAMYPRSARAHYLLGMTELGLGDRASATAHLTSALELLAGDPSLDAPARNRIEKAARDAMR